MERHIAHMALLVKDYDEAIDFYVNKLKFCLVEDTVLSPKKCWVLVAPQASNSFSLLLAKADGASQEKFIGNQSGGRVFLFLNTNNFKKDYQNLLDNKIKIIRKPVEEIYGTVAVFEDLYGNYWDLIEPKQITLKNIVIIDGGIIGLSTAYFLLKENHVNGKLVSEIILEKEPSLNLKYFSVDRFN